MYRRLVSFVGCATLCVAIGACSGTAEGPAGVDSCDELADLYIASYQDAIDAVELADPEIPDGLDSGEDLERLDRIFHIVGGLDWLELHSEIGVRWGELGCEPGDPAEALRSRASDLSYETPVGEYLVNDYFDL